MIHVEVKRPEPVPPPPSEVTITLDAQTARMVKAVLGLGTIHFRGYILKDGALVPGKTFADVQSRLHKVYHAMTDAGA